MYIFQVCIYYGCKLIAANINYHLKGVSTLHKHFVGRRGSEPHEIECKMYAWLWHLFLCCCGTESLLQSLSYFYILYIHCLYKYACWKRHKTYWTLNFMPSVPVPLLVCTVCVHVVCVIVTFAFGDSLVTRALGPQPAGKSRQWPYKQWFDSSLQALSDQTHPRLYFTGQNAKANSPYTDG